MNIASKSMVGWSNVGSFSSCFSVGRTSDFNPSLLASVTNEVAFAGYSMWRSTIPPSSSTTLVNVSRASAQYSVSGTIATNVFQSFTFIACWTNGLICCSKDKDTWCTKSPLLKIELEFAIDNIGIP